MKTDLLKTKTAFRRRLSAVVAILAVLVLAGATTFGFAQKTYAADASYGTDSFNVNVVCNENNSFEVMENIGVDFYYPHHGIYRYIQSYGVRVSNIRVPGYNYEHYRQDGNEVLQIGDADYTLSGKNQYQICYRMTAFDDQEKDLDRLMLNVIPTGWETSIRHATARIDLPKKADLSNIQVYSGPAWSEENALSADVWGSDDGKSIYVDAYNVPAANGITVIVELPEGYWVGEGELGDFTPYVWFLLLLGPIGAFILWFLHGRDKHMVKTIEFYPPEGLTPGEIGYIIDNRADKCDIISTIVYLANKGYMSIEEYGRHDYKFRKLRDIGKNEPLYVKDIFAGLFGPRKTAISSDLGEQFGRKYEEALEDLAAEYASHRKSIYSDTSKTARMIAMVLTAAPCFAYAAWETHSGYTFENFDKLWMGLMSIIAAAMICKVVDRIHSMKKYKVALNILLSIVVLEAGLGLAMGSSEILAMMGDTKALTVKAIFWIAELVTIFLATICLARTTEYTILMGKILGFRDFIKTAELDKLQTLVEENPTYFYDIMPYAYVFGLSDKWIKNFENIEIVKPDWYAGTQYDFFDGYLMGRMMSNCSAGVSNHIRIPIDTSGSGVSSGGWFSGGSGGGFSGGGGGFSGGGFGGGGGGAW